MAAIASIVDADDPEYRMGKKVNTASTGNLLCQVSSSLGGEGGVILPTLFAELRRVFLLRDIHINIPHLSKAKSAKPAT
jgi:hypothetical protein